MDEKKIENIVELLEKLKEAVDVIDRLEQEKKMREKEEISKTYARECSATIINKGDKNNLASECSVEFNGVKGLPDKMLLATAFMSSLIEGMPKREAVRCLSTICTIAITGEGISKQKPDDYEDPDEDYEEE